MFSFVLTAMVVYNCLDVTVCLDKLKVKRIDRDIACGAYYSSEKEGIVFNSTASSVSITDLEGNQLLKISDITEQLRFVSIRNDLFVQLQTRYGYLDFYIPNSLQKEVMDQHTDRINFEFLYSLPSSYHYEKLKNSIESFVSERITFFIIESAYVLGRDRNYTGPEYPSIQPLYLIAHNLEGLVTKTYPERKRWKLFNNYTAVTDDSHFVADDDSCFEYCPPCPEQECLSLCGYGCNCWKWICGDCCYHLGCYGHDVCCRNNFVQTKCLFPTNFECNSEYSC